MNFSRARPSKLALKLARSHCGRHFFSPEIRKTHRKRKKIFSARKNFVFFPFTQFSCVFVCYTKQKKNFFFYLARAHTQERKNCKREGNYCVSFQFTRAEDFLSPPHALSFGKSAWKRQGNLFKLHSVRSKNCRKAEKCQQRVNHGSFCADLGKLS